MKLGDFHSRISAALRKGSSLDGLIPGWVAESANLIETAYTFSWMKKTVVFDSIDFAAAVPNQLTMPERVKNIEWLRTAQTGGDGSRTWLEPLLGVDPLEVSSIGKGWPQAFWLDGLDYIYLDAVPPAGTNTALVLQMKYAEYTDWPGDDNATPSLLTRGQTLLASETLLLASQETRDPRLTDVYTARRDRAFQALVAAEAEIDFKHNNGMRLSYAIPT